MGRHINYNGHIKFMLWFKCKCSFLHHEGSVLYLFFSILLPRFDKFHETSQIFLRTEQTLTMARTFGVIFKLLLVGKWPFLLERGCPKSLLKKSQKGHFCEKINVINDTQTLDCEGNREYSVIVSGICRGMDKK